MHEIWTESMGESYMTTGETLNNYINMLLVLSINFSLQYILQYMGLYVFNWSISV